MDFAAFAALAAVAGIIIVSAAGYISQRKKANSEGGCKGGCKGCPMGGSCPSAAARKKEEKK